MTGFAREWLALREPADAAARNDDLLGRLARHFAGREHIRVLDLGCGTGSNLRATAPALPPSQQWHLIDHDVALLDAARAEIHQPHVTFEAADLRADLARILANEYDLITAAALFDLVSDDWLGQLVDGLAARRLPLYTVLNFDGAMSWLPRHPADERIAAAFAAHQRTDKGFGPAAGSDATACLTAKLERAGYSVSVAPSPWQLGAEHAALIAATAQGIAAAARETGLLPPAEIDDWHVHRRACTACMIGHSDLLALPRR